MKKKKVFDGRVIFDHLPKTGGQAINYWLRNELGHECVTDNLIGDHTQLINRYGGKYSIISSHVNFEGGGFDPRYQYLTIFRDPINRAISHLYYLHLHYDSNTLPKIWHDVDRFISTEGADLSIELCHRLTNPYVHHLSQINRWTDSSDSQKLTNALDKIEEYTVWGFYESLLDFATDFSRMLGIPAPKSLKKINVTSNSLDLKKISRNLHLRLFDLLALDIELYSELRRRYELGPAFRKKLASLKVIKSLMPINKPIKRQYLGHGTDLVDWSGNFSGDIKRGELIRFSIDLSFSEPVADLEYSIHILDSCGRLAFGTNTLLLSRSAGAYAKGIHRLSYYFVADLPDDKYTIGFAAADRQEGNLRELAWYDGLLEMKIVSEHRSNSNGYTAIPIDVSSSMLSIFPVQEIVDFRGEVILLNGLNACLIGGEYRLEAELVNRSDQAWIGTCSRPISMAYRWHNADGSIQASALEVMLLPFLQLETGKSHRIMIDVKAPNCLGRHQLEIFPVYGDRPWLNESGFSPKVIDVSVHDLGHYIILSGSHCSLNTQAGLRVDNAISSTGKNGFLLFGPYMPLPSGKYCIQFYGKVSKCNGAYVDVVSKKGHFSHGKSLVRKVKNGKVFAEVEIIISEAVDDLETRIWVTEVDDVRFDYMAIVPSNDFSK